MPSPSLTLAVLVFGLALPVAAAKAAELRVIAGGSITSLMKELGPPFEQASGHKLSIHFDSTPNIITRINSGTPFDLAIVPVDVFKDAAAKAHFAPAPAVDIARVGYGVAVRTGPAKPDISTPDA
jgi:molybdate transport system substrate-binding protein